MSGVIAAPVRDWIGTCVSTLTTCSIPGSNQSATADLTDPLPHKRDDTPGRRVLHAYVPTRSSVVAEQPHLGRTLLLHSWKIVGRSSVVDVLGVTLPLAGDAPR